MKKLLVIAIILSPFFLKAQNQHIPLKKALKNPNTTSSISISANDGRAIKKFISRLENFSRLNTIYINDGFTGNQLQNLVNGIKDLPLDEVIVNCDTLKKLVGIIVQLQATDKITLIEPFILPNVALKDIKLLQCKSLGLHSSTAVKVPLGFEFPAQAEKIELLGKQTRKNDMLVEKMVGLKSLTSLYISTRSIATLPKAIGTLPYLKNLEVINASDIDIENNLATQKLRMAKKGNECNQLVSITYNTDEGITDAEHQSLGSIFKGFYFLETSQNAQNTFEIQKAYTPVFANAAVPQKQFTVNTNKKTAIKLASGTIVNIPKNAFTTEDGLPVSGEVTVSYREMKTPAEIFASGVNMVYDSSGVAYQFQSAGNFEILASQDGTPLQLAQGKQININYQSASEGDFNFYRYNVEQQNWEYMSSANQSATKEDIENATPRGTNIVYDFDSIMLWGLLDLTPYSQRFLSSENKYILDKGQTKDNYREMRKSRRSKKFFLARERYVNSKRPLITLEIRLSKHPSDSSRNIPFRLRPKNGKQSSSVHFPELASIAHYKFRTAEPMTEKEFKKQFMHKKKYNDVRVLYDKGEAICTLVLKHNTGIVKLVADITDGHDNAIADYRIKIFGKRHARYQKYLYNRITRLDNSLEYKKQCLAKQVIENRQGTFSYTRYRTLRITGLGLFNCDQPMLSFLRLDINLGTIKQEYTPPTLTNMTVKTAGGLEFSPKKVYVFDESVNGVLTFTAEKVEYQNKTTKKIMALDENQNVYVTYMPIKKAIEGNTVLMKEVEKNTINNTQQLETLLVQN